MNEIHCQNKINYHSTKWTKIKEYVVLIREEKRKEPSSQWRERNPWSFRRQVEVQNEIRRWIFPPDLPLHPCVRSSPILALPFSQLVADLDSSWIFRQGEIFKVFWSTVCTRVMHETSWFTHLLGVIFRFTSDLFLCAQFLIIEFFNQLLQYYPFKNRNVYPPIKINL